MDKDKRIYLTTTLPYVNAEPHIGFALEIVQADVVARAKRVEGNAVFFNTGTDEHGVKILRSAEEAGLSPRAYADEKAGKFKSLLKALSVDLQEGRFIRTTDEDHVAAAREFWERCAAAGDIYTASYRIKYCSGCELEKTDSELVDGKCPLHPNLRVEEREEENYFFKFSKYQKPLLELYGKYSDFVVPASRLHEIKNFVSAGIKDFSVSRLKDKMPWGIPVPGDDTHVMYVWFDALVNYVSTLGWPSSAKASEGKPSDFETWWGTKKEPKALQFAGKDNLRQQAAMWQALLISVGLPTSRQIMIHGFITADGQKMSKSLGNVVDPFALVEKYGVDAVRYYLLREVSPFEDGDFSEEKFRARYNGDLANGLGNFAARTTTLASGVKDFENAELDSAVQMEIEKTKSAVRKHLGEFRFNEALSALWELIGFGDAYANRETPWAEKNEVKKAQKIYQLVVILDNVAALLLPFLPETAGKITANIFWNEGKLSVKKIEPLFPRLD